MRCLNRLSTLVFFAALMPGARLDAQAHTSPATSSDVEELRQTVRELALRVSALEEELHQGQTPTSAAPTTTAVASLRPIAMPIPAVDVRSSVESVSSSGASTPSPTPTVSAATAVTMPTQASSAPLAPVVSGLPTQLPGGATLNYTFDGYYDYDFNHPIGRVQYLRAYDVLSNAFSINQADIIFDLDPDVAAGRRYGVRIDLQYGQATETLQGNPSNEVRPEIYRNIFQAYGTYVVPVGKGLTVDFGKWASSLGIEGNYTKDQVNYSRSFFFDYLPFYHAGVRASYKINDKLTANYWLVNGTNQSEPTNSFKDELFGFVAQPTKNISWTVNYYFGQDHPDVAPATNCPAPVQPGLCLQPITPAPDGRQHMFDSYVTWNATPKLTFSLEGDYLISREWEHAAPGESSAPGHVDGGAAYVRYQVTPKTALGGRTEYFSDRDGLYSGTSQALKEFTGTYEYKWLEGLLMRAEYRADFSNEDVFSKGTGQYAKSQQTLTVAFVAFFGPKR